MKPITTFIVSIVLCLLVANILPVCDVAAQEIPLMTKEELKQKLGDEEIIIVDVRIARDWDNSEFKIKGAVRENPHHFSSWATKYPKDKTIVLYCA